MSDNPGKPAPAAATAKASGDFVKTYVIVMGLLACVLGWVCFSLTGKKAAFADANAQAMSVFGGPTLPASQAAKPTAIRALAVDIQKYLQTLQQSKTPPGETTAVPIALIRARAEGMQLAIKGITPEMSTPNRQRGFEEVSTTITFEATDLERLATFLYNLESSSTKLRILDVRWDLKPDRENPYLPGTQPGYLIQGPTVKIGLRRPITK